MKPKFYYDEIFRMNYYFCVGWKPSDFSAYMIKAFKYESSQHMKNGLTILIECDQGHIIVIWTRPKSLLSTLVHECIHASVMTFGIRGVDIRHDDGEVLAYHSENLFNKSNLKKQQRRRRCV